MHTSSVSVCIVVLGLVGCSFPRPDDVAEDGSVDDPAMPVMDAPDGGGLARYLAPRYLPDVCDTVAEMPAFVVSAAPLDTSVDGNCNGGVVGQFDGPEICVVRYRSIEIGANDTLQVVGARA